MLALAGVWGIVVGEKDPIVYCFKRIRQLHIIKKYLEIKNSQALYLLTPLKNSIASLSILFLILLNQSLFAQNAIVGDGFSTGWGGGTCPTTATTDFKYFTLVTGAVGTGTYGLTTVASGTGLRYWRFGVEWSGVIQHLAITPSSDVAVLPNTKYSLNTSCTTSGSMTFSVANTSDNFVFKTLNAGTNPTGTFIFFEVQGAVQACSTHTAPTSLAVYPGITQRLTVSMSGNFNAGQAAYIRYHTGGGFSEANISQLTYSGTGNDYYIDIPASINAPGTTVAYYFFTSGSGLTISNTDADLYTINLLNNGGSNYSYQVNSTWQANTNGNWNNAGTWNANQVPPSAENIGTVIINADVTLNQDAIVSSLTINSGKTFTASDGTARNLRIHNNSLGTNLNNNGTWANGSGASTVFFSGNGAHIVAGTVGFYNVTTNTSINFGNASTIINNFQIDENGYVSSKAPFYGNTSTLIYNTGNVFSVATEWYANMSSGQGVPQNVQIGTNSVGGSGLSLNNNVLYQQCNGNLTIGVSGNTGYSLALSTANGGDIRVGGNWTHTLGTFTPNDRAIFFIGPTGNQTITAPSGETFDYVIVDKDAGDIVLANDIAINQTLTLTKGNIILGANNLTFGASAPAVAGAPSAINMIVADGIGEVRKVFTGNGSFNFPIGDTTGTAEYSPVSLNFSSGTFSNAYAAVRVTDEKHPNNSSATNYLTRYWTVSSSGITAFSCTVIDTFPAIDISGSTASMVTAKWNSSLPWVKYGAVTASTITATSVASFGDFTGITAAIPTVTITANPGFTVCQNSTPTLTANPVGDPTFTYLWSTGDTTQTINPSTAAAGNSSYSVTVTDGNGFSATSAVAVVTVNSAPIPTISHDDPTTFCEGQSVDLHSSEAPHYLWNTGEISQSITVASSGSYTVTVTYDNGCTATSLPEVVTVLEAPIPIITANGPTTFCHAETVILTSSPGPSYRWSTNATTQSITVTASGSYTVKVTYANGCERTSSATVVTVNNLPTATINPNTPQTICPGTSVELTASGGTGYVWSNTATTTAITVSSTGIYTVTVTDANGCTDTESASVTVADNVAPSFIVAPTTPRNFCVSDIIDATFYPDTMDISPIRPDYHILTPAEKSLFDLSSSTFSDNCTLPADLILHWRIEFNGTLPADISGTGQLSGYTGEIKFDGAPSADVTHHIKFWLEDGSGNLSTPEADVSVIIKPRPNIIKQ